jgi:NADPH2:quinone reductase
MKAVVCHELGPPSVLRLAERAPARLGPGQVRIAMRAAALNYPDLLMVAGGYQLKPPLPFTPGLEGAGTVAEAAPDAAGWRMGDDVIVRARPGTFAEEVVAAAQALLPKPAALSHEEAAALTVGHGTAWHALVDRGRLAPGETLRVHGASGGVGLAAIELGKLLGARVIATGGDAAKLAVVQARGADAAILTQDGFRDAVLELTDGRGADVVYDPVGGEVFTQSLRCVAWRGRILVVGFPAGIPDLPTNYALLKGCAVIGVRAGEHGRREPEAAKRNRERILALAGEGRLRPHISHRLPLARAAEGLELLRDRKVVGKAVLVMD